MKNRSAPKFKKTDDADSEMQFLRKGLKTRICNFQFALYECNLKRGF